MQCHVQAWAKKQIAKKVQVVDRNINEIHLFKAMVKKGEEYIKFKIY